MKKLLVLIYLVAITCLYSASTYASGGYEHHYEHHRPHHLRAPYYREVINYYPQPRVYRKIVNYYPAPRYYREERHYYPQPRPQYYPQPHYQSYYDNRSTQGLAGGVIGSVFGYQMGDGDPLVTGIGAAAGSFIGNGMSGR
jgi:hypothetical protein